MVSRRSRGGGGEKARGSGAATGRAWAKREGTGGDVATPKARTVQEVEATMLPGAQAQSPSARQGAPWKSPLEAKGFHCEVRKHSDMGCAVVSVQSEVARQAILDRGAMYAAAQIAAGKEVNGKETRPFMQIRDVVVQMRHHVDKATELDIKTDVFMAWGRQAEKQTTLTASAIADAVDGLLTEAGVVGLVPQAPYTTGLVLPTGYQQPGEGAAAPGSPLSALQLSAFDWGLTAFDGGVASQGSPPQRLCMPLGAAYAEQHMRADAPPFTPPLSYGAPSGTPSPVGSTPTTQAPFSPQQGQQQEMGDMDHYHLPFPQAPFPPFAAKKTMQIVDPKSGEALSIPSTTVNSAVGAAGFEFEFAKGRRPLKIVDPGSGKAVDIVGFREPTASKFSIIDPRSGAAIKV